MHTNRKLTRVFFGLLVALVSLGAFAHSNEYLDTLEGEHGGQLRMSGAYHFELVIAPGKVKVYVTDHAWQPIETAGATANLMVTIDGNKNMVSLKPAGINRFEGDGNFTLNEHVTVHLKVTMPNGDAELATFMPLRKKDTKPVDDGGHDHHKHH